MQKKPSPQKVKKCQQKISKKISLAQTAKNKQNTEIATLSTNNTHAQQRTTQATFKKNVSEQNHQLQTH